MVCFYNQVKTQKLPFETKKFETMGDIARSVVTFKVNFEIYEYVVLIA